MAKPPASKQVWIVFFDEMSKCAVLRNSN